MQDNKTYTTLVNQQQYPTNKIVPLDPSFSDERGIIQNLINAPINGAAIITSKTGTTRSNHYHKEDFHYLYVLSGSMEYYERGLDEEFVGEPLVVNAGQMVFTPPMKVHKTVFLEDTVLVSLSKNNRDHNSHEADVIRVQF
jgi:quercetin dioxygenase-like cupin family protein